MAVSASSFGEQLYRFDVLGVYNNTILYLNAVNFSVDREGDNHFGAMQ